MCDDASLDEKYFAASRMDLQIRMAQAIEAAGIDRHVLVDQQLIEGLSAQRLGLGVEGVRAGACLVRHFEQVVVL